MLKLQTNVKIIPLLFTILAVIIMLILAIWQLCRLHDKTALLSHINLSLNNVPVDVDSFDDVQLYSKVSVQGQFLPYNIYLYRRAINVPGKDGCYLFSPFKTNNNQIILVARGWVQSTDKKTLENKLLPQQGYINGIVLPTEKPSAFIPNNDLKDNIWFVLNLKEIAQFLHLELVNVYLLEENPKHLPIFIKPIPLDNLTKIKNDHLEYAITWLCLAVSLIVIYVIYRRKSINN